MAEIERIDPDGPQMHPMQPKRAMREELRKKLRQISDRIARDKLLIRAIQFTSVLLVMGLAACVPVQPPAPPPPPPPPPVTMNVPFPPVAEPVIVSPPPVVHRRTRVYHATSRCPAGMYWSTSRRVTVAGTTKTKTVRGACVSKKKDRIMP